ncbi:MAG: extracellular solute-binding protein [Anaerolineae bacterium]|nr:extracellular solute-binding protein [Anaerolineae bacterium]NUQ05908.1 extracellular solute-binding protein [Anaerolineae bacterium]
MRKALLLVLALLALGVGVTAAQSDLESVDPTGVTITYWHQFTNVQAETMTALVEQFNSTNEYGITVEAIAQGNYNDIRNLVNAGIVSGELPNLVAGFGNDAASYFRDGAAQDLRPFLDSAAWGLGDMADDYRSDLLPFNSLPSGEVIAFPHQTSAQVLAYNQTLLSELGFEGPARSWDDFKAQACAAANYTGPNGEDVQGYPITTDSSLFESWVASQGGVIFDGENYVFDSEPVVNAFQLYADLYAQGCAYIPAERFAEQADFARGLNPFFATSTAGFTFIVQAFVDSGYEAEWSVTTFPYAEGQEVLQVFIPSIILVGGTPEEQVASWLFLKSLVAPEAGAQWSSSTGYFGASRAGQAMLTDETAFGSPQIFPYFTVVNDTLNSGVRLYSGPSISAQGTVRGLISEAIANVTSNGMSVEEAVGILQAGADQALADSQ